jgi:hypothetical protein
MARGSATPSSGSGPRPRNPYAPANLLGRQSPPSRATPTRPPAEPEPRRKPLCSRVSARELAFDGDEVAAFCTRFTGARKGPIDPALGRKRIAAFIDRCLGGAGSRPRRRDGADVEFAAYFPERTGVEPRALRTAIEFCRHWPSQFRANYTGPFIEDVAATIAHAAVCRESMTGIYDLVLELKHTARAPSMPWRILAPTARLNWRPGIQTRYGERVGRLSIIAHDWWPSEAELKNHPQWQQRLDDLFESVSAAYNHVNEMIAQPDYPGTIAHSVIGGAYGALKELLESLDDARDQLADLGSKKPRALRLDIFNEIAIALARAINDVLPGKPPGVFRTAVFLPACRLMHAIYGQEIRPEQLKSLIEDADERAL